MQILQRVGQVDPVFIQAKGFHLVGVLVINLPRQAGKAQVLFVIRRHQHQSRRFLFCLPYSLAGGNPQLFGNHVLGKNDAMAIFRITRHGNGNVPDFRPIQTFDRCIEIIHVNMEYRTHNGHAFVYETFVRYSL